MSGLFRLKDLHVSYGSRPVIGGVGFEVRGGELCALLGLNGSGKSTLLKAVCGLIPSKSGEISVDGRDLRAMHERERAKWLTYIPQRGSAGTGLTVLEVVLMGFNARLGLLESPGKAHREKALETLERVGLPGFGERIFDRLSEGQRQLVIFSRALVQDTPVMLMDEPDSALDFVNRHQILGQIAQTVRAEGKAGLITLHDPNFAMAYCDRLLLLRDGALVGDVAVENAAASDLSMELSKIYGAVQVAEYQSQRFMLRAESKYN